MRITLKLIGPFIYSAGFSEKVIEVPDSTTPASLLPMANLDKSRPKVITRNGRAVGPNDTLEDGDRIVVAPIYSGG